ncbi:MULTISPECIES: hypothetical protein [Bacteroides]|jgi:hypothetical protein|uniref:hypothetical protein n=1 Tax=Bacteroides TaxID=816 RepID=UPI0001DAA230|nr:MULTISPECIES: hypothetical protein [Bacteroides]EFI40056.1 hypothetical protein HMPREF9010_01135 [Bacteroides sp. 3_1_23]RGP03369.1 hypothetical protein DXA80_20150 [Bacteroides ovatus]DAL01303.1 MAG TPA: hypothetical protein [Caudoviricetes sp.]
MFETSYFDRLQDYLASGCTMELTDDEMDYYNALYALIGIQRKYGKDNAISFLMHDPFQVKRARAREMYNEAINLFFANDSVENNAHRNMMYDNLQKAAQVVLMNAHSSKDMEVYGNLMIQAAKIKQLDKPDPQKRKEVNEKPIKIYMLDTQAVGMPQVNRQLLAEQIDSIPDIPEREKVRLKRDAQVIDVDIIEMLDDQETKTKDID